jgi:hypothetical protein
MSRESMIHFRKRLQRSFCQARKSHSRHLLFRIRRMLLMLEKMQRGWKYEREGEQ